MGAGTRLIVSQTGPAWPLFHGFFVFMMRNSSGHSPERALRVSLATAMTNSPAVALSFWGSEPAELGVQGGNHQPPHNHTGSCRIWAATTQHGPLLTPRREARCSRPCTTLHLAGASRRRKQARRLESGGVQGASRPETHTAGSHWSNAGPREARDGELAWPALCLGGCGRLQESHCRRKLVGDLRNARLSSGNLFLPIQLRRRDSRSEELRHGLHSRLRFDSVTAYDYGMLRRR